MALNPSSNGEVLNPKEAATFLRTTVRTLKFWRSNRSKGLDPKGPPYSRTGHKTILYLKADLIAWIEENKPSAG